MKRIFLASTLALATAFSASAMDSKVESVKVDFDLTAVKSQEAAHYWRNLEPDLETAIVERIGPNFADKGLKVDVDIDELNISDTYDVALGRASVLQGIVTIKSDDEDSEPKLYDVKVLFSDRPTVVSTDDQIGIVPTPTDAVYGTMVDTFADRVASKID